jgi:hypothetical protein
MVPNPQFSGGFVAGLAWGVVFRHELVPVREFRELVL